MLQSCGPLPSWQPPYNEENVVHLAILDQNGAETDFRGPKVTPIGAGWTKKMKHCVWDT